MVEIFKHHTQQGARLVSHVEDMLLSIILCNHNTVPSLKVTIGFNVTLPGLGESDLVVVVNFVV